MLQDFSNVALMLLKIENGCGMEGWAAFKITQASGGSHPTVEAGKETKMAFARHDEVLDEETQAMMLMAYYDARKVSASKLRQIFRCTDEDLNNVRLDERYQAFIQAEELRLEEQARDIDEKWNNIEQLALGGLSEAVESIADPRTLLGIAIQANKAQRRAGPLSGPTRGAHHQNTIDPEALAGPSRVVRLRTRFIEQLQRKDGTSQLIEREIEVTDTRDIDDAMNPAQVKSLLKTALGVDTTDMKMVYRSGPDSLVLKEAHSMIDFNNVSDI